MSRSFQSYYVLLTLAVLGFATDLRADSPFTSSPGNSTLSRDDLLTVGIQQRLGNQIPDNLTFTDSTGRLVDFHALLARKPTLLALVYYQCPNLCTLVLNGSVSSVADLRRTVGDGFQVVVVSIDPTETPSLAAQKKATYLRRYSRGQNQDEEWSFLVGDEKNIRQLADAVGYRYRYDPTIHQFAHGSGIMLVDDRGRVVKYFLGIEYSPEEIEKAIQLAHEGEIGSPVQQFFLLCYCYNPLTGPYGFLIFTILKVCALATVAALATFIVVQIRRDGRRKAVP
jgi:protein SCO1/2